MNYLILVDDSIHIPGDQRSIDHPGHGYHAHNEKVTRLEEFDGLEAMKTRMAELKEQKKTFRAFKAEELVAEFSTLVEVKVK